MNSLELKDKKTQLKKRAIEMIDNCKVEIRDFNDAELTEFNSIKEEINKINEELRNIDEELSSTNTKINKTIMEKNFSLIKAIRSIANNKALDEVSAAVVDAGAKEMRNAGLNYVGQIQLPAEERAAITVASEGEDTVATDLFDVVKPLQAKNVMIQAGAKYVTGLVGNLKYPVMGNANCAWEGETAKAKNGEPTFKNVELSPKRLATVVAISKQFLVQDSVGAEQAIREEIINAINAKLESTILGSEQGTATQPEGLFYKSNGDAGLTACNDFKAFCDMEGAMEEANVYGEMKYLVSPKAKAAMRGMSKGTKSTQLLFENSEVDGTPALCSSHLKNGHIAYGDFSQYIIGMWGNLDITVDNVTLAADGQIRLVVNAYFDAKPLRPEAIKVAKVGA